MSLNPYSFPNPLAAWTQMMRDLQTSFGQGFDRLMSTLVQVPPPRPVGSAGDTGWTVQDRQILASVDRYLARGLALKRWWSAHRSAGNFEKQFELGRTFNPADLSFGFFDHADVDGAVVPVMGNFQQMFYDQPKTPQPGRSAPAWMRSQVREFVLQYFMRVSDFRQPSAFVATPRGSSYRGPFSWCASDEATYTGFGFQQLYYRRRKTGEVGKFPDAERFSIIDLRRIGTEFDWIVAKVRIFDFNFTVPLGRPGSAQVVMPLREESYLVLSSDFITDEPAPSPGILGRYGLGYSFLRNPQPGPLAYGPGEFDAAFEVIDFSVEASGKTEVSMVFVANQPDQILNLGRGSLDAGLRLADLLSLGMTVPLTAPLREVVDGRFDPVYAYITLANLVSGGFAESQLCISREELYKSFLVKHFLQHYQAVSGTLPIWRLVCDWTDRSEVPRWAAEGKLP